MKQVKTGLSRLTVPEKVALAEQLKTKLTGNANFTTPVPTLAQIEAGRVTLNQAYVAKVVARLNVNQAIVDEGAASAALDELITRLAAYVQAQSAGDEAKIVTSGFGVRNAPAPVGLPAQPGNLRAATKGASGTANLSWEPVRGAASYEVQLTADPGTEASWQPTATVTKSSALLTDLEPASKCWFRVRAIGAAGAGAWSDPSFKIVQ